MGKHWTIQTIEWDAFSPNEVDTSLLAVVKTAALVEYNAHHYVDYLVSVFKDYPDIQSLMRKWGQEELQHGRALAKWACLADPHFDFGLATERFNASYKANENAAGSVRGSLGGEMISRCVVESATSFFYTGLRDRATEPVLKQIAAYIARDEFSHYQLFLQTLGILDDHPGTFSLIKTALSRVGEVGDDELASAYYAANLELHPNEPYHCEIFSAAYTSKALALYREDHAKRMSSMIARALGVKPYGRFMRLLHPLVWKLWQRNLRKQQLICAGAGIA